jgi:hypothetical protein
MKDMTKQGMMPEGSNANPGADAGAMAATAPMSSITFSGDQIPAGLEGKKPGEKVSLMIEGEVAPSAGGAAGGSQMAAGVTVNITTAEVQGGMSEPEGDLHSKMMAEGEGKINKRLSEIVNEGDEAEAPEVEPRRKAMA